MNFHCNGETESHCERPLRGCHGASSENGGERHSSPSECPPCCHSSSLVPWTLDKSFPLCKAQFLYL